MGKHIAPNESLESIPRALMLRRVVLIVGLLLVGIGVALGGYSLVSHKNPIETIARSFVKRPDQVFGKPNLVVLVEGLDYDYDQRDLETSKQSRSDVIWAVNLDFVNKHIYQLSIPRDMIATLPNGSKAKINQAQSDGGAREAKSVIANWLGIHGFDRYMVLRIDATKDLITALGGVDVTVKNSDCLRYNTHCTGDAINYDDSWGHLHIHLAEGTHHLNGEQAVGYMRFRHDWCSDPCRIMRQQQVLHAVMNLVKSDKVNTLFRAGALLSVFRKDVETDFSDSELWTLASYFSDMAQANLLTAQVPYTGDIDLPGYGDALVPDESERSRLVATMLIAPPSPEASPDVMALAAITPSSLRIDVENGSGVEGAAHRVADVLQKAGFGIGSIGDAPTDDHATTEIHEHSSVTFAGARVREVFPNGLRILPVLNDGVRATATPGAKSDVTIVVGRDFVSALTHPTAPASP